MAPAVTECADGSAVTAGAVPAVSKGAAAPPRPSPSARTRRLRSQPQTAPPSPRTPAPLSASLKTYEKKRTAPPSDGVTAGVTDGPESLSGDGAIVTSDAGCNNCRPRRRQRVQAYSPYITESDSVQSAESYNSYY
jgi:hypothetical protein